MENDVFTNIMIGVVGGILSTMVIQSFVALIKNTLIPRYRAMIYDGIVIDGKWVSITDHKRATQEYYLELNQKADSITGTVVSYKKHKDAERKDCETFVLKGRVKNRLFFGEMAPTDSNRLGQICFLLDIVKDGAELSGNTVFYNTGLSKITSSEMILNRTDKKELPE
jgi:hypothetical protein